MAGFFLTFSFFKMLNLKGFKDSDLMYDIIAQKFPTHEYGNHYRIRIYDCDESRDAVHGPELKYRAAGNLFVHALFG